MMSAAFVSAPSSWQSVGGRASVEMMPKPLTLSLTTMQPLL